MSTRKQIQRPPDVSDGGSDGGNVREGAEENAFLRVQDPNASPLAGSLQNVLDSLTEQMAVLNLDGKITFVNEAWRRFGSQNGASADRSVGMNYSDVCRLVRAGDAEDVRESREGVKAVLEGSSASYSREYLCDTPEGVRWFMMLATPLKGEEDGAVILHVDITTRKRDALEVQHLAQNDLLTGAANRHAFYKQANAMLAEAETQMDTLALSYFDLDGFKKVNEQYGHAAGDELLRAVVSRLRAQSRGCDLLARFGGDEFVMLIKGVTQEEGENVAKRLCAGLEQSFFVMGRLLSVRSSCGTAFYPQHGETLDALLHHADRAMYEMKRQAGPAPLLEAPLEPPSFGTSPETSPEAALELPLEDRRQR